MTRPASRNSKQSAKRMATSTLATIGAAAGVIYTARTLINFFGPALPYSIREGAEWPLDSPEFLQFLSIITDGTVRPARLTRLKNGSAFYPVEIEAIRGAQHSINLEYYEFKEGAVGDAVLDALVDRARAGVQVRMVVDAIGSFQTRASYFDRVRAAGGQMHWYHPLRWDTWQKANNRTHRKLLVIDGTTGFIGGAGIADHWVRTTKQGPPWRDTVFKVEGGAVAGLLSTFSENWLESSGEILSGDAQFGFHADPEGAKSFVVSSTPHGGGTQARILFQALIKSARKSIQITTPYFLPDRSARHALEEAVQQRGVKVQILTAGPHIDHPAVRRLSRHSSRHLIEAGAEIYEYQPAMIHAKLMTVDGQWNVFGSTNFDHRSFALNDEVNLASLDRKLAQTLAEDFAEDLRQSQQLTLARLKQRTTFNIAAGLVDRAIRLES